MRGTERFHIRYIHILWLAGILGLLVRLYFAWQPTRTLIVQGNSDDAYYYFTIARHIAEGKGASFDGLAPTNGFHPLYMMLLVPLFWLFPDSLELNIHLGLTMLMLFNVLTAFVLYNILSHTTSRAAGLIAAVAWLFNPWVILISLGGVESAVYVFFVALTAQLYVDYRIGRPTFPAPFQVLAIGISMGLTILARSDGVFLLAAVAADIVFHRVGRPGWAIRFPGRCQIRKVIMLFAGCGLVLLPWLGWNILTFGTIKQVSGAAIFRHNHMGQASSWPLVVSTLAYSTRMTFLISLFQAFQIYLLALLLLVVRVTPRYRSYISRCQVELAGQVKPLMFLALYAFLLCGFYAWVLLQRQLWYFLPLVFVLTVAAGILYHDSITIISHRSPAVDRFAAALTIGFFCLTFGCAYQVWTSHNLCLYPAQSDGYKLAQWLARETEPQARIGAWDSGIIGYYSNRIVINLDGVVNNQLFDYVVERDISAYDLNGIRDYIQQNRINYLTDYEAIRLPSSETEFKDFLEPVYQFPSTYGSHQVQVFRVSQEFLDRATQ